jgi:hypothetical protein
VRLARVPRLDRDVSVVGLGCASLGSRISAADGRRAIDRAIDLGLTWFDVAPSCGDGHAEALKQGLVRAVSIAGDPESSRRLFAPTNPSYRAISRYAAYGCGRHLRKRLPASPISNNPDGVVIISMFDTKHIERNIAASCLPPIPGFADAVRDRLA